jgi:DNA processing protein
VSARPGEDRIARAILTHLAEPPDSDLSGLLSVLSPGQVLASIRSDAIPSAAADALNAAQAARLRLALSRWRAQLAAIPADGGLTAAARDGIRLVCPADPEWPSGLDDLGIARPCALWVRGSADLRTSSAKSLSIVGGRAATAYGRHVATEIGTELASRGWAIVSGAAYGIDAAAHAGALAVGGITIAVLASGPDVPYPREHRSLLADITAHGAVISEYPPGSRPTRLRFLARNRIIAALGSATVVVEVASRSGSMNTARHATQLARPLMAVPGPVTSPLSAGCHELISRHGAACVARAADILTQVSRTPA